MENICWFLVIPLLSELVSGQLKVVTVPSLEDHSDKDIKLPCDTSLNRNNITLMWITWIQNATKVYEYDGASGKHNLDIPGYKVDLKQAEQGDTALKIARNTLTVGVYTFKCEVTEGSSEGRGETTLTVKAPPKLIVTAEKNVTVTKLPYDLTCSISNLRWNKVETMTLTWKENGKDLFFFDGSKSNSQSERYRCDKANPSHCLLRLNEKKSNGDYTCIVTEGKAEGSATIKVKFEVPDPSSNKILIIIGIVVGVFIAVGICIWKFWSRIRECLFEKSSNKDAENKKHEEGVPLSKSHQSETSNKDAENK